MTPTPALEPADTPRYRVHHESLSIQTHRRIEFIDVTDLVVDGVRRSAITDGTVNVQTLHTTTAVRVNENEPLLLEDLERLLERLAPRRHPWRHDDFSARHGNLPPDERANGDAHARALLLGSSETLNIVAGEVRLGRWQRVFLVELDGRQRRTLSLVVMGIAARPLSPHVMVPADRRAWRSLS